MVLSEDYKRRLAELCGLIPDNVEIIVEDSAVANPYAFSKNRIPFDMNLMKTWIEQGAEIGVTYQSNNEKYKMPIWKQRIFWPFAMGYDKNGQLIIRGVHVEGQSEKKALETNPRQGSAQAKNEWRLLKVSNLKSMFPTGAFFQGPPSGINGAYNPNDSAMSKIIVAFDRNVAIAKQKALKMATPVSPTPVDVKKPVVKAKPVIKPAIKPAVKPIPKIEPVKPQTPQELKAKADRRKLKDKIDKITKQLKEAFQISPSKI